MLESMLVGLYAMCVRVCVCVSAVSANINPRALYSNSKVKKTNQDNYYFQILAERKKEKRNP